MIIALIGPFHCGKTTAANRLIEKFGFVRHPIAGPMKNMLKCLGLDERHVNGELKEVPCAELGGKTPRFALQQLGKEWGRDTIWDKIWTTAWTNTQPEGDIVVEDVRFPTGIELIRRNGGKVVKIIRAELDHSEHRAHASENQDLGKPDWVVHNNKSIEEFNGVLDHVITLLSKGRLS